MYQENRSTPLLVKLRNKIQYLSDNCSLQCLGYVLTTFPTPLFGRLFWLATITVCCVCSANVLRGVLTLYTSEAVSYSVETDYLEWETPFPALTICEQPNTDRIKKYLIQHNLPTSLAAFSQDVSFWNPKFCRTCTSCKMGQTCVQDFLELVKGIRMKCAELLTDCWWDGKPFPCCERFRPIATEYGTCFVFNSLLTGNNTILSVNRKTGLPSLVFTTTQDIAIRIHSLDDMITVASENILSRCSVLPLVSDFDVMLKAEQTISDVSVQPISPDSRDCLFKHERPAFAHLWPFPRYSYSACVMYCRAITQAEVCNCTHHFMPQIGNVPKCDIEGLACLHITKKVYSERDSANAVPHYQKLRARVIHIRDNRRGQPARSAMGRPRPGGTACMITVSPTPDKLSTEQYHCPMGCEEVAYKVSHVTCPRQSGKLPEELSRRGSRGRMYLGNLPTLRVRRHAIRELLGLVVDVGGVISVFFGASLLSFIEIIYIFFIRKYP